METCMRGFSFVPEAKVEVINLQFIEGGELERTWKTTRRQRLKQQEQKIWNDFVQEQDVVKTLCTDDPYQFLEQLPEPVLKELMETELQKMQKENAQLNDQTQQGDGDNITEEEVHNVLTIVEDREGDEENVIFHIFNDDKDDEKDEVSGPEAEVLNDSLCSPCTVREKVNEDSSEDQISNSLIHTATVDKDSTTKSTENVSNVIESSIYCAKVKDLRMKIDEQMLAILTWLERRDVLNAEAEDVLRMCKRSAEFSNRFNRVYMYQLHRQMHDVKRHNSNALPFAKHTQFQSQMVRIVSLHQNMCQAYQVLYKSLEQTSCLRESADCLRCLVQVTRDVAALCRSAPTPKDFAAAAKLYNDAVLVSCDKLDQVLNEYSMRMADFLNTTGNNSTSTSRKSKNSGRRTSLGKWKKVNTKSGTETDTRLSMYSLETLRLNLNPKSTSSKDNQSSGTSKTRGNLTSVYSMQKKNPEKNEQAPKSNTKSPRSRRPLMRDPHSGKPRAPKPLKDTDIRTMVEAVATCTSSHISREVSPRGSPRTKKETPRRKNKEITPRNKPNETTQRKSQTSTPRPRVRLQSPRDRQTSPVKPALGSVRSDSNNTECSQMPVTPISKVQCAKKEVRGESPQNRPKDSFKETKSESPKPSPRLENVAAETVNNDKMVERENNKPSKVSPGGCEVTRLLRQLCTTDVSCGRNERLTGAKNAQLLCITGRSSPRAPSTPQLLKILEETIRKKAPKPLFQKPTSNDMDRFRMEFNISEKTSENLFQYRTKFVQHMLSSPMYANSAVGKPWEMIGSITEQIIDELLLGCAKELELRHVIEDLYWSEMK